MKLDFLKMHGAGNDFVVVDARKGTPVDAALAMRLADRRFGVGCDQVVVLEASKHADLFMRLFNADGSEIGACGNASRCVGQLLFEETGKKTATIETLAGVLSAERAEEGVTVDMGEPKWEWADIPLAESRNTLHLGLQEGILMDPVAINIGNPHMVFFVRDIDMVDLAKFGPKLEHDPLYPKRANVSVVKVVDEGHLRMKTWERGAGLTLACGSAACSAVVAGVRRELCKREATVEVPGGTLQINWKTGEGNGRVLMTGPAAKVFSGTFDL